MSHLSCSLQISQISHFIIFIQVEPKVTKSRNQKSITQGTFRDKKLLSLSKISLSNNLSENYLLKKIIIAREKILTGEVMKVRIIIYRIIGNMCTDVLCGLQ